MRAVPTRSSFEARKSSHLRMTLSAAGSAIIHLDAIKIALASLIMYQEGDVMERRHFLKLTFGFVAGATALVATATAAPLPPISAEQGLVPPRGEGAKPAGTTQDDVERLKPEAVRWHRRHWGWGGGAGVLGVGIAAAGTTVGGTGAAVTGKAPQRYLTAPSLA